MTSGVWHKAIAPVLAGSTGPTGGGGNTGHTVHVAGVGVGA